MIKISFIGDISLNNKYNEYYSNKLKPFDEVQKQLITSDFVIGNLECISKGEKGENLLKKPRLSTETQTLNYLKDMNITTVTLAHNHIYDNLESGFNKTIQKLKKLNINYLGAGNSEEEANKPLIVDKNGIKVAYLNYVTKDTNPNIPSNATIYLNFFKIDKIKHDIQKIKNQVDYVVCLFHWGGKVEKGRYPDYNQPKLAYDIIDVGADLIIGHHSHTLQPFEVYKGKYIFYSLGNFCFDDIISDGKVFEIDRNYGCKSIIVEVDFFKNNYKVNVKHIINDNLFIRINSSEQIKREYNRQNKVFNIIKKREFLWKLYYFKHKHYNPIKFYFFGNGKNPLYQAKKLKLDKIRKYILKKIKGHI